MRRILADLAFHAVRPLVSILLSACLVVTQMGVAGAAPQPGLSIKIIAGNDMELIAGSSMTKVVTIEVDDAGGKPVADLPVTFTFPQQGRPGGATDLNQYLSTGVTDAMGQASVHVKAAGPLGAWQLRVTAGGATITVALTNVNQETQAAANGGASPAATQPPPQKKSHLTLILLIVAGAAGGGAAAALAGKKSSSGGSQPSTGSTGSTGSTVLTISTSGSGSFSVP